MLKIFDTNRYVHEEEKQGLIPRYGKVARDTMKIVWPAMVEGFLVALVGLFDGIMVAELGNSATAAVTITKQPVYFMICFITALNIAVTAIIARRKGAGDHKSANRTMHVALICSLVIGLILSLFVFLLCDPINKMLGANADTIAYANDYMRIIALGFVFNALRLTINACQRGIGQTHISMITNIIANLVNIFFNYLLITGNWGAPRLEVAGAAIATVIGNAVAFLICLATLLKANQYLRFNIKALRIDKETFNQIKAIFPSAMLEQAIMRFGFILFAMIVNYLGTEATYVHGVCNDINSLMFTIADGFAIGTAAVVGHRLGEKRNDLAIVYAKVSMTISICVAILVCLIMIFARTPLVALYKPETEEAFNKAKFIMLIAAVTTMPQNIQWVLTGILRGSGDTKFTATTSLISVAIIRPIVAYVLCYFTPLGVIGAWIGMFIDQTMRLSANIWRFKSRAWLRIEV